MDLSLEEKYMEDMKIVKEELKPYMVSLEEKNVNVIVVLMFFSSYVREVLKDIDDKNVKELIIRNMLD